MDFTGLGSVADLSKTIINKIFPDKLSDSDKLTAQIELEKILSAREQNLVSSQKDIIVAELNQEDKYTKRMRPSIGYAGLFFILLNYIIFPYIAYFTARQLPNIQLPEEFWWAWGGVCSAYVIGRSFEKTGNGNSISGKIVGK